MGRQTNRTIIGAFTAGAVILAVAGVVLFGSGTFFSEKNRYVLFFDGSVQGLTVGSPVVFRGVKIGSVKEIRITTNPDTLTFSIPVVISIEDQRFIIKENSDATLSMSKQLSLLIDKGLRAQLEMQSMVTGQLIVNLDFHPFLPVKLVGKNLSYPEIPTIQSDIEKLTRKIKKVPVDKIFNRLLSLITTVEEMLTSEKIQHLITTIEAAANHADTLIVNLDRHISPAASSFESSMEHLQSLSTATEKQITALGNSLDKTAREMHALASGTNRHISRLTGIMDNAIKEMTALVRDVRQEVSPISSSIQTAANASASAAGKAAGTLENLSHITGRDSELVFKLTKTLEELSSAAKSFRILTQYLERHPDALVKGRQ